MDDKILQNLSGVKKNVSLANYTTYKIGGPARYFFVVKSKEDLIKAIKAAKEFKLPVCVLGGGSNVLVSDKGYDGLVIKIDISKIDIRDSVVFAGAGTSLNRLAYVAADAGLSGLEWVNGIPGITVGGAVFGHAQAFGAKISDAVESIEAINVKTLKSKTFSKKDCRFSLKNSYFKKNKNWIIVSASLNLRRERAETVRVRMKEFLDYRKSRHPVNFPSAGSVFVNPEVKIRKKEFLVKYPELNEYNKKGNIPAGYLIANSGLLGKTSGKAQISEKHGNFIINLGGAKAKDVFNLIKLARKKVKEKFKVDLKTEIIFIGF